MAAEDALTEAPLLLVLARARTAAGASCDSCSLALFSCFAGTAAGATGKDGGLSVPLCQGTSGGVGLALGGRGVLALLAAGGGDPM